MQAAATSVTTPPLAVRMKKSSFTYTARSLVVSTRRWGANRKNEGGGLFFFRSERADAGHSEQHTCLGVCVEGFQRTEATSAALVWLVAIHRSLSVCVWYLRHAPLLAPHCLFRRASRVQRANRHAFPEPPSSGQQP